jgi:hypothetical protein
MGYKGHWGDPIGAHYSQWSKMNDAQRVQLMLETAIDLAMDGFAMADVLLGSSRSPTRAPVSARHIG